MSIVALIALALLQADAPPADRLERCLAIVAEDPERGYEEGMAWASEAQAVGGYRCAAMALAAQNRHGEAARRFETLAMTLNPDRAALQAELLSQAGNAWLAAREPARAVSALTRAVAAMRGDREQLPDLLIDRARAYAMEGDWRRCEEDLSASLDLRGDSALALRLRATARMNQNAFDLAETDALAAARLDPENVENYLVLGHVRESRRIGAPIEAQ
jgi:tetratricopeptide (TPR) repeat protein